MWNWNRLFRHLERATRRELEQRVLKLQAKLAEAALRAEERTDQIEKERKQAEERRAQDLANTERQAKEAQAAIKAQCSQELQVCNLHINELQGENDVLKRKLDDMSKDLKNSNLQLEEYGGYVRNFDKFLANLPLDLKRQLRNGEDCFIDL